MPYLINPFGRLVPVAEEAESDLLKKGFKKADEEQVKEFIQDRMKLKETMTLQRPEDSNIYMATVTQGGKDGYGIASNKLIDRLRWLGMEVSLYQKSQKVGLLFHNPYSILRMENPFRIIFTMFESTKIPADWKDYLEAADLLIVPSKWCQQVFKNCGFESRVVPLGYDEKTFVYKERKTAKEEKRPFTFLHYNAFNIRKGFSEVWEAFNSEFSKDENVRLVLKTVSDNIPLPITKPMYPNVDIISGSVPEADLLKICQEADCFVFPSRGEGFGITPLEAMATGCPAIVPNAHGITEYFNSDYMYEVKVKEECPALYINRYRGQDVGTMVMCDVDDLRRQMRYVYEHQNEALEMGKLASDYVKQWTFATSASKLKAILDEYLMKPVTDKPLRNLLILEKVR